MKFSVSSSALLSLLATTGKVISNKNTLPILDYFLMELNGNELKVTTSDLETTLIGSITVDSVESEGTIAAPGKLMLDSLKEFPELPLTIDVNDKNWEIRINWKSGSLSIPGASAVSYPAVPQLSAEKKELKLDVDTLVNGINKTIFATADDELRPVMNGIYINLAPDALTFVGTDAHKLVKYESETANDVTASFILPKKPANLLKSVLLKEEDAIDVAFDSKNAVFGLKNHTLICRLIEGQLPELQRRDPDQQPQQGAGRPHRTGERHQARGGLLEPDDQPHPHEHRRKQDRPDGAGPRLLGLGQRDDLVQLRRPAHHDRLQVDLPRRDPLEHGDADGGRRTGRLDARRRLPPRLRRQADERDADAPHAYDDQRIKTRQMKLNLKRPIVFFDLETTGVDTSKDRIVEISMIKVMPDGEEIVKTRKLNPGMHIPEEATAVHGITDEDVKDCPTFAQVAKSLEQFVRGCDFGGFNSNRFDLPVLVEEFLRAGVEVDFKRRRFVDVQNIFHKRSSGRSSPPTSSTATAT